MSHIQDEALKRALPLLRAAGAQFAVIDANGVKHGDLEVAEPKKRRMSGEERIRWHKDVFPGYREQIEQLAVGGQLVWKCADAKQAKGFQKVVSGKANAVFGSGKYITAMKGLEVELLRVE